MQSIVIFFSSLIVICMTCSAYVFPSFGGNEEVDPLVIKCLEKDKNQTLFCVFKGMADWKIDFLKPIDPKSRQKCCFGWDVIDCIEDGAKVVCTREEYSATVDMFSKGIAEEMAVNCTNFPYHSPKCQQ